MPFCLRILSIHLVFVYGTLKRGFPNYDEWMKPFKYIADGKTCNEYRLIAGGPYFSLILMEGEGHPIIGEIYEVDEAGLAQLDQIESVGKPLGYKRLIIDATISGQMVKAWIYLKNAQQVDITIMNWLIPIIWTAATFQHI